MVLNTCCRDRLPATVMALLMGLVSFTGAHGDAVDETSLYQRVGGYDVIAAVVDDFLVRYDNDPALARFLGGLNAAENARIRQHFVDYLCAHAGGPCLYLGRDMPATHEGLSITAAEYDQVMRHLAAAMAAQSVPSAEKEELLHFLEGLRGEIENR